MQDIIEGIKGHPSIVRLAKSGIFTEPESSPRVRDGLIVRFLSDNRVTATNMRLILPKIPKTIQEIKMTYDLIETPALTRLDRSIYRPVKLQDISPNEGRLRRSYSERALEGSSTRDVRIDMTYFLAKRF